MRRVGKVGKKWIEFREEWKKNNPPPYTCGICNRYVSEEDVVLDHIIARSRRPDLRFVASNIQPSCYNCNSIKGSRSIDELTTDEITRLKAKNW